MFRKSQRFYDAIYSWKDYPGEAAKLDALIRERVPGARTLLDVACGTGRHLELLRDRYQIEGTDLDPEMLAIARQRLGPDVPLHVADMVGLDLKKGFDVVTCLFSAIAYGGTEERLRHAIAAMAGHLEPGGALIVEPFFTPEEWSAGHVYVRFVDQPDLKIVRMDVSSPPGEQVVMEFHYLVGTPEGIEAFTERHVAGLFTHEQMLGAFRAAGLDVDHDPEGLMGRGLYVGTKPAGG